MMETITVTEVVPGKFGERVKVGDKFYSYSKFFKGMKLKAGETASVELFKTEAGNFHIKSAMITLNREPVSKETPIVKKEAPLPAIVPTDWKAKDRSQLVGGRSHDAVELVNVSLITGTPLSEVLMMYQKALEGVLEIAEEVK